MTVLIRSHDFHSRFFFCLFIFSVNSFPPHKWHNHTLFIHEGNAIIVWIGCTKIPTADKKTKKINRDSKRGEFVLVFKKCERNKVKECIERDKKVERNRH